MKYRFVEIAKDSHRYSERNQIDGERCHVRVTCVHVILPCIAVNCRRNKYIRHCGQLFIEGDPDSDFNALCIKLIDRYLVRIPEARQMTSLLTRLKSVISNF